MRIAERILECKAAAIVVVNKWDLSKEKTHKVHNAMSFSTVGNAY